MNAWPIARAGEALELLATLPSVPRAPPIETTNELAQWMSAVLASTDLEVEETEIRVKELEASLRVAAPALIAMRRGGALQLLAIESARRGRIVLVTPEHARVTVSSAALAEEIVGDLDDAGIGAVLDAAGVTGPERARAIRRLVRHRWAERPIAGIFVLRSAPGSSFREQLASAGVPMQIAAFVGAHALRMVLVLAAWWIIGAGALSGHLDRGWLAAWALLLVTIVPIAMIAMRAQGLVAVRGGAVLKRRLLHGALSMEPEEVRHLGSGQLLGQVIESSNVESLTLGAGLLSVVGVVELAFATFVLARGAGGWPHAALLLAYVVVVMLVVVRFHANRGAWTDERIALTNDLVERMVGHRTRLAQEPRARWHEGEDGANARYVEVSRRMDTFEAQALAAIERGWLLVGLAGLVPALLMPTPQLAIGIGLGGVLLAYQALDKLVTGAVGLAGAAIGARQISRLFHAAGRSRSAPDPNLSVARNASGVAVRADRLGFRHPARSAPVFEECSFEIEPRDRVLLTGPSGGGKSTMASLLLGLRRPGSGLLLLDGLDGDTLGPDAWRRRVTGAPQFHENHVLAAPFAFNALMGAEWPPSSATLRETEALCRELGLGPLLDRMPGGMFQLVGDTGWQLSHGEKSRLYIARALAQDADLVILDESFAALDPENLERAMRCVVKRARAVLVVAHP